MSLHGAKSSRRCAIYTRKSSEEGLEQDFNSLHAQRGACEAYVLSQAGEGWTTTTTVYDDGGFSGGSMQRPALQQLLADIAHGLVDIVLVYKVDRLTRSLSDFARIVEIFDRRNVSFVSVTQAFNTTSSMGRLTLNVLLSFAQFEREVTGERIRDKIAASKAKGLWMGGVPSLGYDPDGRTLKTNPEEAERVRHIFRRYLELRSVSALRDELNAQGARSKRWITRAGKPRGGIPFKRGALFHLLRNRLYRGEIRHGRSWYAGLHSTIVPTELFDAVQTQLDAAMPKPSGRPTRPANSPLKGLIVNGLDRPMTPVFAYGRHRRIYRYYVAASLARGESASEGQALRRVAAAPVETLVQDRIRRLFALLEGDVWGYAGGRLQRVAVLSDTVVVRIAIDASVLGVQDLASWLRTAQRRLPEGDRLELEVAAETIVRLAIPSQIQSRSRRPNTPGVPQVPVPFRDQPLVKLVKRAHAILAKLDAPLTASPTELSNARSAPDSFERKIARFAFLAPDLQRAILEGRQPTGLTVDALTAGDLPLAWADQRALFDGGDSRTPGSKASGP